MKTLKEYLLFKKMIMPIAIQILFWAGIGGCLYGTWWLYTHGNRAWIFAITLGPLLTRLVFEGVILKYQSYVCLTEIRDKMRNHPDSK